MAVDTAAGPTPPIEGGLTVDEGADLLALLPQREPEPEPEAPADEKQDPVEAEAESLDVPEPEAEPEEKAPPGPELHEVKVDGEVLKVPLEELKKSHSKVAYADRQMQKNATERKAFEAERARENATLKASRDAYATKLEKLDAALASMVPEEPDFEKIRQETPEHFASAVAEWQLVKDKRAKLAEDRKKIADEQDAEQAEQKQAKLLEEGEKLREIIPELKDEKKAPALKERLFAEGERRGFTRDEVALTSDHRLVSILHDAMLYRDLLTRRDELKKQSPKDAPKAAPVLQPGTRTAPLPKGRKEAQVAFAKLKESGSIQDAARVLRALDL